MIVTGWTYVYWIIVLLRLLHDHKLEPSQTRQKCTKTNMQKYQQFLICLHKKYASKNTAIGKTNMIYCNSNKRQSYRLMPGTYKRYGVKMLISFNSFVFFYYWEPFGDFLRRREHLLETYKPGTIWKKGMRDAEVVSDWTI